MKLVAVNKDEVMNVDFAELVNQGEVMDEISDELFEYEREINEWGDDAPVFVNDTFGFEDIYRIGKEKITEILRIPVSDEYHAPDPVCEWFFTMNDIRFRIRFDDQGRTDLECEYLQEIKPELESSYKYLASLFSLPLAETLRHCQKTN